MSENNEQSPKSPAPDAGIETPDDGDTAFATSLDTAGGAIRPSAVPVSAQSGALPGAEDTDSVLRKIFTGNGVVTILAVLLALILGGLLIAITDKVVAATSTYFFARPGDFLAAVWSAATGSYIALFQGSVFNPRGSGVGGQFAPLMETLTIATGHFFRLNLRNHHLSCLDMANAEDGKKKAHDITVIKRRSAQELRYGAAKGRKVLLVWDKACIDYHLWHTLKHTHGIYFLTLEKSNSAATICSVNQIDRSEPRNAGIISDHHVSTSNGVMLRRIVYTNPEDAVTYSYLTNDFTLPAYQLVLLYKHRWDVEKIFHQLKSKLHERKSWASSLAAKQSHAIFQCLAVSVLNSSSQCRSPWAVGARPVRRLLRLLPWSGARRRCGRGSARRLVPGWRRGGGV